MVEQIPSIDEIGALAIEAGKILLSRFGKSHHVKYKSLIDPVTEADKLSEAFLLENIYQKYPDHQIIAEDLATTTRLPAIAGLSIRWTERLISLTEFRYSVSRLVLRLMSKSSPAQCMIQPVKSFLLRKGDRVPF